MNNPSVDTRARGGREGKISEGVLIIGLDRGIENSILKDALGD